tara:strand:- start:1526 stop:2047 length:522 start_codon:yes stop_codon:yes gene_type:complete
MDNTSPDLQEYFSKMNRPIPGQSLTEDPDSPASYVSTPEYTDQQEALEWIFERIMSEEAYPTIIEALENDVPVMELTQYLLFTGFNEGKWNPDLLLLLIEPTAYLIMAIAERADVDYVVSEDEEEEMFGVSLDPVKMEKLENKEIPEEVVAQVQQVSAPSLMERPEPSLMQGQ